MKIKKIKHNNRKARVFDFETPSHTYILENNIISHNTQAMYSTAVVSGGTGIYYSSDDIWIIGRRQEKDSKGLKGWNFIINVEKSREVIEKSQIPITVTYEGGIQRWSGLREVAVDLGYLVSSGKGKWSSVDQETGEVSPEVRTTKAIDKDGDFWKDLFTNTKFCEAIEAKFTIGNNPIIEEE